MMLVAIQTDNGDGGVWIKEPYDPEVIVQLDRFHVYKEIKRQISDKEAQEEIRRLFDVESPDEMLKYIEVYATSMESSNGKDRKKKALYKYLNNNRAGLLLYDKQGNQCTSESYVSARRAAFCFIGRYHSLYQK